MASAKALKLALRSFGELEAAVGSTLEPSGTVLVAVQHTDETGTPDAPEANRDAFHWLLTLRPPPGNLYAGRDYHLLLTLSSSHYPFQPPSVKVKTPIFSPIVEPKDGSLCEGLLKNDQWRPTTPPLQVVSRICTSVFVDFGKLDTLNEEAAKLLHTNRAAFEREVARVHYERSTPSIGGALLAEEASMRHARALGPSVAPRVTSTHAMCMAHTTHALTVAARGLVQSAGGSNLRSPLDAYEDRRAAQRLSRNGRGNYYRYQQRLWPSEEALERALSEELYASVERTPLQLLPRPSAERSRRSVAVLEGRGSSDLLDSAERELLASNGEAPDALANPPTARAGEVDPMEDLLALQQQGSSPISQKIITEADIAGTVLASARERAREVILEDLGHNELVACASTQRELAPGERRPPSARDAAPGVTWSSLGLDSLMAQVACEHLGQVPSRLQSRLLPALLHEDHNDCLFNGVTGSGKSTALLLAVLQGIRSESAGLNVLVAANTTVAMRLYDGVHAMCRCAGGVGGRLVDRPAGDFSWLLLGTFREDYEKYYAMLRRGLRSAHGPARLVITTADVMCELLFEKKMEFEDFGYLRRVYVDDVGAQIPMVPESAPVEEARERLRNPLAAELLLGTLHQMPGPHIRSLLQLGLVSADVDDALKDHLKSLCVKPDAHTTVMTSVRIPSTVHCLFSFFLFKEDRWAYVARLIWNARETIPGRAILFIHEDCDILQVRRKLRGHGMDAKIFSEVYANGEFQTSWKFLLLRESEAFGLDIPLVSHVFITFAPTSWRSYLHMCGRTGRLGNVGWVYAIADKREAKYIRGVAESVEVDFTNHVVDEALRTVPADEVDRLTRAPTLYGMDPQYAVRQHYEVQMESPEAAYRKREFFTRPHVNKQFQMENYTPIPVQQRSYENARKLAQDVERNPRIVADMVKKGMLDEKLRPTKLLRKQMKVKSGSHGRSPFESRPSH